MNPRSKNRKYVWAALVLAAFVGVGAMVRAAALHTFATGDTLAATDLNGNFTALDQRLAALEAKAEPFAGTFPAVRGLGSGGPWFCGTAPATIVVSPAVAATSYTLTHAFGDIVYTSGGAVGLDLSMNAGASACTNGNVCAAPVTYFLKSAVDQTLTIHAFVDNTGAAYVNGTLLSNGVNGVVTASFNVTANTPFSVSFMSCSNDGPSLAFTVNDAFITKYNLQVDYDATFHRNGK
jgi:hypothetical protein